MKKFFKIYSVRSIDLSKLGGPMGSVSSTSDNWIRYTNDLKLAIKICEKDYKKYGTIIWQSRPYDYYSGDLGHCEYIIKPISVESE